MDCNTHSSAESESKEKPESQDVSRSQSFPKIWAHSTKHNNLTLHGFRRFKTSHLVNLRFLEEEIAQVDHEIYQAGLKSMDSVESGRRDILGLRFSKRDDDVPEIPELITNELVLRLKTLLKEYDDALAAFNKVMAMETFSLQDDVSQSSTRTDLHPYEIYHTRLVRVDLGPRSTQDPFHRLIHKSLRALGHWTASSQKKPDEEQAKGTVRPAAFQNSILLADILARFLMAITVGVFMVLPLVMISYQSNQKSHLITIAIWIIVFSILISTTLKTSGINTISAAAAYSAVLSVFVSNS